MNSLYDLFFSPVGKEYCLYFRIVMYLTFLGLVITTVTALCHLWQSKNKHYGLPHLIAILQTFLSYFVTRLLYSMCLN